MGEQPVGMAPAPYASQSQMAAPPPNLSRRPQRAICPYCKADVVTAVQYETGCCTIATAIFLGCCFFIALCTDCTKDTVHTCPSCGQTIGVLKVC